MRPISDHTRSGLKEATDLTLLRHSLNTYDEIAAFLKFGFYMHVGDVDAAFPLLPLHPSLWPFFLFMWFDVDAAEVSDADRMMLFCHICGDFGAAGLPGAFKLFFSDCVVGMARSELIVTLPLVVYVDDTGSIGPDAALVDAEAIAFGEFCAYLGIFMKELKRRAAAQVQLMLGFWWDIVSVDYRLHWTGQERQVCPTILDTACLASPLCGLRLSLARRVFPSPFWP